jgi:hypothetical protein
MSIRLIIAWTILSSPVVFVAWMFYAAKPEGRREVREVLGLMVYFSALVVALGSLFYWALQTVAPGIR